jgi:DNA-directed RNA polymerase specialized sigma24 family protein
MKLCENNQADADDLYQETMVRIVYNKENFAV